MLLLTIREAFACAARFSVDVIQDERKKRERERERERECCVSAG